MRFEIVYGPSNEPLNRSVTFHSEPLPDDRARDRRKASKKTQHQAQMQSLIDEAGGRCIYCTEPFSAVCLPTIEHLNPLSRGGTDDRSNLGASCERCNNRKGSMTHEEFMRLLGAE